MALPGMADCSDLLQTMDPLAALPLLTPYETKDAYLVQQANIYVTQVRCSVQYVAHVSKWS